MNSHADHPLASVILEVVIPSTEKPDDLPGACLDKAVGAAGVRNDQIGVFISDDADAVAGTEHRPNVRVTPIIAVRQNRIRVESTTVLCHRVMAEANAVEFVDVLNHAKHQSHSACLTSRRRVVGPSIRICGACFWNDGSIRLKSHGFGGATGSPPNVTKLPSERVVPGTI